MILDLTPVVNFEGKKMDLDVQLDFKNAEDTGLKFLKPVSLKGTLLNIGGSLELSASIVALLEFDCDRCCESLSEEFEGEFTEILRKEDIGADDKNPDAIYYQGNSLDLDDIVLNNIILQLPSKHLCREDCKGLCPTCGKNLNLGECDCESTPTDPRFDVLDSLLGD
ncbi:MAG: DUF177 domain-containing protein [Clostridia bacterium]|nr:DUF177 domain-containing protein [Clostridia bacterium]